MKGFKLILASAFIAGGAVGYASVMAYAGAQHTITEKGKVFSQADIAIKTGDTVVFVNDDNIAHNVMSNDEGNKFNLGLLQPGTSTPVTFDKAGEATILCAIHPSMKMHVKINN